MIPAIDVMIKGALMNRLENENQNLYNKVVEQLREKQVNPNNEPKTGP